MTAILSRWFQSFAVAGALLAGGVSLRGDVVSLIPPGATWNYFKGQSDPTPANLPAWRQLEFDDSSWLSGPQPLFYGEPLSGTDLRDMRGRYSSVYLRRDFEIANPETLEFLTLKVLSDDGFVAWINGVEVARFNVPSGELRASASSRGALSEPLSVETFPVGHAATLLRTGRNVLAIHAFNSSLNDSSDFVLDATLEGFIDTSLPTVERLLPTPGAIVRNLTSLEVTFSRRVQGVEAEDLLVNETPASSVAEVSPGQFLFTFPALPAGPVTARFRDGHSIIDFAQPPHPFEGGSWTFTIDPDAPAPGVILNEFMAANDRTLRDEDGNAEDWIELFNSGPQPISLTGWYLTDDLARPTRWQLPAVSLDANDFLVVFASGKNRTNDPARLHTNFRLSRDAGNHVALMDSSGTVVSAITNYPAQADDVSYGRPPGAPNLAGYFVHPTPGGPNAAFGPGFAPPVEFSVSSRTYQGTLTLGLATTNANATIRYTTDGTLPHVASLPYTAPLQFTTAVQVRAQSFVNGLLAGPVRSETFIPLSATVATFTSDLPVLLIHHFGQGRPSANTDSFAHVQFFEPGTNGFTSLTSEPTLTSRASIAARGSSTEGYPKVSLKLEFQDELGFGRALGPLGMPPEPDWVLYAPNNFEPILIHNPLAHQLSRDIGRYSPRTRFVEVYFAQQGLGPVPAANYHGIYVLEEKIKLDSERVNAPKLRSGQNTPPQVTGGYLMKIDRPDPGDNGFFAANQWIQYVSPKEEEIRQPDRVAQRNYLQQYMDSFGNALYGSNFRNPVTGYRAFIEVGSWIDHHLLNVLTFNVDALRLSAYFYKQREGKLHFGPLWDFDRALWSTDGRDLNPRVWRSQSGDRGTDFFNYPWWDRLFRDPDFFQEYIDRYQELRRNEFSATNLWRWVDDLTSQVIQAQPREQARWGVEPRGGSYAAEVTGLKRWLTNRLDFMDRQFVQPPTFLSSGPQVPAEFTLEMTVPPNTTVYYTLDGTDPRRTGTATGNDLAPGARQYEGPIPITANSRVVARACNPSHTALTGPDNPPLKSIWSGPVAETYVVKPFPIRLTEIMYHPTGDGSATVFTAEDFEFLELHNFGTEEVDLTGFQLEGTADFTFAATNVVRSIPPDGRLLLVSHPAAFASRYPDAGPVAGIYQSRLSNSSGRLALFGPLREPVFDFRYWDTWQPDTDGDGPSLVLREEDGGELDPADPASWRTSQWVLGSPGAAEAVSLHLTPELAGDTLRLALTGQAGRSYTLQQVENLGQSWQAIETQVAGPDGAVTFNVLPASAQRLFRVVLP